MMTELRIRSWMDDEVPAIGILPDGTVTTDRSTVSVLFPGSFNPLHDGHRRLALAAERRLSRPVQFELSIANVDKPSLPIEDIARRVAQFRSIAPIWLTRAARFEEKARLFPGSVFVMGHDTAVRLIDPRYYDADRVRRDECLRGLAGQGSRAVVGGRLGADGVFRTWEPDAFLEDFREFFVPLLEADFRVDLSSSELRQRSVDQSGGLGAESA